MLTSAEKDERTEPIIQQLQILFQDGNEVVIKQKEKNQTSRNKDTIEIKLQKQGKKLVAYIDKGPEINDHAKLLLAVQQEIKLPSSKAKHIARKLEIFIKDIKRLQVESFSPIRSKPKRTYVMVNEDAHLVR